MEIGPNYLGEGICEFVVWAPCLNQVALEIVHPAARKIPMKKDEKGYWKIAAEGVDPGTQYYFLLENNHKRPDPGSHYQPEGVHGPSEIMDHSSFSWRDDFWKGMPLEKMIIYELHVGAFTPEGIFEAAMPRLHDLHDLGITAIELMPVAQFSGTRNWGYDGVYPFAVQNSYGGPAGLKKFVNACHTQGFAVILDVVYNHLGPEGNYLADYGPYFTNKYKTPWGNAVNFDAAYCDGVRNYFINNALHWFHHYHIDALRLDAIHGIFDMNAKHILEQLAQEVEKFSTAQGRKFYLIAESDLNNPRIIRPPAQGGYGIDAQWCDDFHHALHTLLTGDQEGYYADFGSIDHLRKSFQESYVYSGQYSAYRKRSHGAPANDLPPHQFIVCSQNHDQIGNRMLGERTSTLIDFEGLKLAAGTVFISPFIPLLFMGEEYGETAPFLYFIDHSDPDLIKAVREGRKKEFQSFKWHREPPDPQSMETFLSCKLKWENRSVGHHKILLSFYKKLISLKKELPALHPEDKYRPLAAATAGLKIITIERCFQWSRVLGILNFAREPAQTVIAVPEGTWNKLLDSTDAQWMGPGALLPVILTSSGSYRIPPLSIALYERNRSQ